MMTDWIDRQGADKQKQFTVLAEINKLVSSANNLIFLLQEQNVGDH